MTLSLPQANNYYRSSKLLKKIYSFCFGKGDHNLDTLITSGPPCCIVSPTTWLSPKTNKFSEELNIRTVKHCKKEMLYDLPILIDAVVRYIKTVYKKANCFI